ncbi:UdgX family uracil-DNA binding protein [Noviherbaspirillum sp. ST9]|uniref:UdgX family uracil-DNA binding protein n=1 Tax=Noviherbaspirillum sp. ST9 TaxID=3401606 RepID=UPI003B58B0D2
MTRRIAVDSFEAWRTAARQLIAAGVAPDDVQWGQGDDLFPADPDEIEGTAEPEQALRISRELSALLEQAACFRDRERWHFLYRVLWRWSHGEKEVASAADRDGSRLHAMAKAVRREEHDMRAYLRFRERPHDDGPRFVAWYEPAHDVLPAIGRHFADRMGSNSWLIATPDASLFWDGAELHPGPAVPNAQHGLQDAGEALWLTYYRSIFNPARLNTDVMHGHIPSRFWKHLPEARVVPEMVANASTGARRIGQATALVSREGAVIPVSHERARPQRALPGTLDQCRRCPRWERATQAVAGKGPRDARIMVVGEQPGDHEDLAGEPFIGPAGQLLNDAFSAALLKRDAVYLTNAVKHFGWELRGKRRMHKSPGQLEMLACRDWLEAELAEVAPTVVLALGVTALNALMPGARLRLQEVLGTPLRSAERWIIPLYHPAYVLRVPDEARRRAAFKTIVEGMATARRLLAGEN